ncbi:MAG: AAA family ATPase [Desulfobacteraceae bacterium]|nr:AAA family ATPase [Desulfobacteraceae bacterium]
MKNHLENLTIHNFRGLRNLKLPGLGQINLLVGPNNSGKTSVLEAISVFCQPLNSSEWIETATRREIKKTNLLNAFKWLFPHAENQENDLYEGKISISGQGAFSLSELHAHYQELIAKDIPIEIPQDDSYNTQDALKTAQLNFRAVFGRDDNKQEIKRNFQFGYMEQGSAITGIQQKENPQLPVTTVNSFTHLLEKELIKKYTQAILSGKETYTVKIIKQLDPDINGVIILSKEGAHPSLYIRHNKSGMLPLSSFGDGLRRILTIALHLSSVPKGILLIDEIELAVHKSALAAFFKKLITGCSENDIQLFATTHSLEAVDAFLSAASDNQEQVVAYHLPVSDSGNKVKRYSGDLLHRVRYNRGMDVR